MRRWTLEFMEEAREERRKFDKAVSGNLAGCLKIKLKKSGIRVVYQLIRVDDVMKIIVVAARADDEVYEIAEKRISKE